MRINFFKTLLMNLCVMIYPCTVWGLEYEYTEDAEDSGWSILSAFEKTTLLGNRSSSESEFVPVPESSPVFENTAFESSESVNDNALEPVDSTETLPDQPQTCHESHEDLIREPDEEDMEQIVRFLEDISLLQFFQGFVEDGVKFIQSFANPRT